MGTMDLSTWMIALLAVFGISLTSLIGIFTLGIKQSYLTTKLIYLVSFSAGALFGDVFLHLMPEMVEHAHEMDMDQLGLLVIGGVVLGLVIEKLLHWHHCHHDHSEDDQPHTIAKMNLIGDFVHNLIDGLIIGASFLVSVPAGLATSLAILFHEIPQEIGDYAVLIHSGYSKKKALLLNFLSALSAILGTIIALIVGGVVHELQELLVPIAMGMFIYIAGSDLIPELHKHNHQFKSSLLQILMFILGIGVMFGLLFLEGHAH